MTRIYLVQQEQRIYACATQALANRLKARLAEEHRQRHQYDQTTTYWELIADQITIFPIDVIDRID